MGENEPRLEDGYTIRDYSREDEIHNEDASENWCQWENLS